MKIRKSNFWIVLSNIIGYVFVGLGLLVCVAGAVAMGLGYKIQIRNIFADSSSLKTVEWRHFLYAGVALAVAILVAIIFRLIGKAVYKKRVKRALEKARNERASGGLLTGYDIDPETQEKVVDAAKKAVPIVAGVVLACVVVKAVKKARSKKQLGDGGSGAKNYYYF